MFENMFKKKKTKVYPPKSTPAERRQERINNRLRESLCAMVAYHLEDGQVPATSVATIQESLDRTAHFHEQMGAKIDCSGCACKFGRISCQRRLAEDEKHGPGQGRCRARLIPLHAIKSLDNLRE